MSVDPSVAPIGSARDPGFLRSAKPWLELFASYFRPEVRGFDRLPDTGPMLVIGNHSGGQLPPDVPILLTAWWRERGEEEPLYALMHSIVFALPGVGSYLARGGAVEAGRENAEAILARGGILVDFPGGDREVFRPWSERNTIDFGGHVGFVKLALRTGAPIVPAVSVGAHESVIVLTRGEGLARRLRLDKLFRVSVLPLVAGPPFGIVPGGIPTFPLPATVTVELLEPIDWSDRHGPEDADDDVIVRACYDEVVEAMQTAMDRLAAERRYPIIG